MKNFKKEIIPQEMKRNIDEILEKELFNANRYYAENDVNISKLMESEMKKSPIDFLRELRYRWNWHNHFYEELLEPAFSEIVQNNFSDCSVSQLKNIIDIYKTCCIVDEVTLVSSGAIKKHLNYNLGKINTDVEGFSREDGKFMLLTPPVETFFAQYRIDHLNYILAIKNKDDNIDSLRSGLLEKYHANDEEIFKGRFDKKFKKYIDVSKDEIVDKINTYKIKAEYKVKHSYFTIENPTRKAFTDIIIYDNVDEKFISSQLIGISGFLFRKFVLKELDRIGLFPNKYDIYEFPKEKILSVLNELLKQKEIKMEKEITPYKQSGMTCAIACMLMVLQYYGKIQKANRLYENEYFRRYRSRYLDGTPFSALAYHLAKNDLNTELIHSSPNIFDNSSNLLSETMFKLSMEEYSKYLDAAKNNGAKIKNGCQIDTEMLRRCLEEDKMVIIAGQIGEILHAILVCGYDKENFIVCDPLYKAKTIMTPQEIDRFMSTALGKWCITVSQKIKKQEQLLDEIPEYQEEAKNKLDF
ncbi:MAG: C39 family peptidase [Clostridia bacterium]|nr:C39 family peptidase [Clostridia bacterium]